MKQEIENIKQENQLTLNEEARIYYYVDQRSFGDCLQDSYLIELLSLLSKKNFVSGLSMPQIVVEREGFSKNTDYSFSGNYRTIVDVLNPEKNIYVYFDHPDISSSALYLGIFNKYLKHPLITAVAEMNANYKMTPVEIMPMTIKVDMYSYLKEIYINKETMQSLKYLDDIRLIKNPKQLFNVMDTGVRSR